MSDRRNRSSPSKDWVEWHRDYENPDSALSRRLRVVQGHLAAAISSRSGAVEAISLCAGQGHDVFGVLESGSFDGVEVHASLIESDERNVEVARRIAATVSDHDVEIVHGDAGDLGTYAGFPNGDIVLTCGVFGNINDEDVFRTIDSLPQLCQTGATVIWTRSRRDPDLTPRIRRHFESRGFGEQAFVAPDGVLWSVGVNRFQGEPHPRTEKNRMFRFLD